MLACREVMERIAGLSPGAEVGAGEELRLHLAGCAACRAYLEECRLAEHLGGLPLPRPTGHVKSALAEGHAAEPPG